MTKLNDVELKYFIEKRYSSGKVVGLQDSDYEGLIGDIEEILVGDDRETENDCLLDIVVNFIDTGELDKTHGHLNGTSISSVIMGEDELGFFVNENNLAETIEGKLVCPYCSIPMERVNETKFKDIDWFWNEKTKSYEGFSRGLISDGKRCFECWGTIKNEKIGKTYFDY